MMQQEVRKTAEHVVFDDNGNRYVVNEFQTFIKAQTLNGPAEWVPGTSSLELENGDPVNFVDPETYKDVLSGRLLRKQ